MVKVWIPTGLEVPRLNLVDLKPVFGATGERPVAVTVYTEGWVLWYGSGSAEVVVEVLPIKVRLPWRLRGGRLRWGLADNVRREMTMALRKITQVPGSAAQSGPGAEDASSWPNLWDHLTREAYDDGQARQKSTIVIVAGPAGWQGCLSDKDNARVMWKTCSTVEGLLLALEQGAAEDDPASWRAATPDRFKKKK